MTAESIDWPYGPRAHPTSSPSTAANAGTWPAGTATSATVGAPAIGDILARTQRFAQETNERVQRECQVILDTARRGASDIIDAAHRQAAQIRFESQKEAERLRTQVELDQQQAARMLREAQAAQRNAEESGAHAQQVLAQSDRARINADQVRVEAEKAQRAADLHGRHLAASKESVDQLSTAIGSFAETNRAIVAELVHLRDALLEPVTDDVRPAVLPAQE